MSEINEKMISSLFTLNMKNTGFAANYKNERNLNYFESDLCKTKHKIRYFRQ